MTESNEEFMKDLEKFARSYSAASAFVGSIEDTLANNYAQLEERFSEQIKERYPMFDAGVCRALARKRARRLDPVGYGALERIVDTTTNIMRTPEDIETTNNE